MNIRLSSSALENVYIRRRTQCSPELLGTQAVLRSNEIHLPVQHCQEHYKHYSA